MQTDERLKPVAGPIHTSDAERGAVTKTAVEASQGIKLGRMRWVLGVSLVLVIAAMIVAYLVA